MQAERTYNVNVIAQDVLMTPAELKKRLPITPQAEEFVLQSREALQRIIDRQDPRLFVVVGPCSIHDLRAARDYAQRLKQLANSFTGSQTTAPNNLLVSIFFWLIALPLLNGIRQFGDLSFCQQPGDEIGAIGAAPRQG